MLWQIRLLVKLIFCSFLLSSMNGCMVMPQTDGKEKPAFEEQELPMQTQKFVSPASTMYYVATGDENKPSLIFLHGSPSSWRIFRHYLADEELRRKYYLIAAYRAGYTPDAKRRGFSLTEQSAILKPWVASLQQKSPVILVGHSLGASLAVQLAADLTIQPHTVVGIGTPLDPALEPRAGWRQLLRTTPLRIFIPKRLRSSNEELWLLKQDLINLQPVLRKIQCNVVLIHGDKDAAVAPENISYAEKNMTNALSFMKVTIRNGAHALPTTHFTEIKQLLLQLH